MAELIAGIGDEVLLFGAFVLVSLSMVVFISMTRGRQRQRQREEDHQEPSQGTTDGGTREDQPPTQSDEDPPRPPEPHRSESTDRTPPPTDPDQLHHSELRSRFGGHPTPSGSQTQARDEARPTTAAGRDEATAGDVSEDGRRISVRLVLPRDTISISVRPSVTLSELRRAYFQEELSQSRPVNFIYRGRVLNNDSQTLEELDIGNDCAVHIHIGRPRPQGQPEHQQQEPEGIDLSRLFIPLCGIILGIVWILLICYPWLFGILTKLCLFSLSIGYVYMTYISLYT